MLEKITRSPWLAPLAFLFFAVFSYGILAPTLGFYWDDWPMVWFAHTLGPAGYEEVFSGDRPFLAGIYILTTSILKLVPLQWQILGIISRWITALAVWWTMRQLWPGRSRQAAIIALLFTVFPGFKQQPISVVYSNGFFLLTFYILSYGFMIKAMRSPGRYWLFTILALVSYSLCTFSTEYYVSLDMLRPVVIWIVLAETEPGWKQRLHRLIRHWAPYVVLLVIYLIWRVLIFGFPTYEPHLVENVSSSPFNSILKLANRVIEDIFTTGWLAWAETFRFPSLDDFAQRAELLYWVLVLAALPVAWILIRLFFSRQAVNNQEEEPGRIHWARQATAVGLIALFLAGWPFWVIDLSVELDFPWDRFSLSFMLGSCIFVVGLVELVIRTGWQRILLFGLIVSMAAGENLQTANSYRREWMSQKDLFWQLTWRAPALKPGTLVVTNALPLKYYSDNSLTAPLNWTYAPDNHSTSLPYFFAFTQVRLGASIPELKNDLPVRQVYRNASFQSSTSNGLVLFYSPPGCLRVIDPDRHSDLPIFPSELEPAFIISHPDQIIPNPDKAAHPPESIFGEEPASNWCYYFEKAELAGQQGMWEEAARLGDEAFSEGLQAGEPSEQLIFIEAYARTGNWERSMQLAGQTYSQAKILQSKLCRILQGFEKEGIVGQTGQALVDEQQKVLECQEP